MSASPATMAKRNEKLASLDYYPTPPWATRALCEWLGVVDSALDSRVAWEPACGEGHMSRPLAEYFRLVHSSDIADYGFQCEQRDFLFPYPDVPYADYIITNPPFTLADRFVSKALEIATYGVAALCRNGFLESVSRYNDLFKPSPPTDILQFVERVPMSKGRLAPEVASATSIVWIVWRKKAPLGTRFHWIAPCRKRLERASDYPSVEEAS
jgi:hypothetical protein